MNPFLPLEHSGSVKPSPETRLPGMHLHENEVYFRFVPDNLQVRQSFLHRKKEFNLISLTIVLQDLFRTQVQIRGKKIA